MSEQAQINFDRQPDRTLTARLSGDWTIQAKLPSPEEVKKHIEQNTGLNLITNRNMGEMSPVHTGDQGRQSQMTVKE